VEAFAAGLIGDASGPCIQPFWLCTSDEAKQEALGRFRALYDRWVACFTERSNEEATLRSGLTVEAFAAGLIGDAKGPRYREVWLCTSEEVKQEALARFRAQYASWVEQELKTAKARFEIEQEALSGQPRDIN
jgi:hypothetical protein